MTTADMSDREFDGRDLDDALRAASAAVGIPAGSLDYELVEGGRKGVFGLGARPVRIRILGSAAAPPASPAVRANPSPRAAAEAPAAAAEAPAAPAAATLRRMLSLMQLDLAVTETARPGSQELVLDGPDRKRLTARDGELLEALEFVLNRMGRRGWPDAPPLRLSCRGFVSSRDEELVGLAREVAARVAHSGRPTRLEAMNPYERRVVHVTVREFPGLTTVSEGDGFLKRIRVEKVGS